MACLFHSLYQSSEINALLAKDAAYTTTELPLKQKYILFCIVKKGEGESEFYRTLKSVLYHALCHIVNINLI